MPEVGLHNRRPSPAPPPPSDDTSVAVLFFADNRLSPRRHSECARAEVRGLLITEKQIFLVHYVHVHWWLKLPGMMRLTNVAFNPDQDADKPLTTEELL